MEGEQEKRGKIEEEKGNRRRSSEAGAETNNAMTTSVAEEANAFSADNNRAFSDGRGGEDKCSSSAEIRNGDFS